MFCPNCGTADQPANAYCRQCGEFTPDLNKSNKLAFGGNTPDEQIRVNLFLNLLSAVVSVVLAVTLYVTFWRETDVSRVIYLTAAFLLAMSGWQFSTFAIGLKLKKNFAKRKESPDSNSPRKTRNDFQSPETRELLKEADLNDVVPASVVENTTVNLAGKIPRRSSQTEQ